MLIKSNQGSSSWHSRQCASWGPCGIVTVQSYILMLTEWNSICYSRKLPLLSYRLTRWRGATALLILQCLLLRFTLLFAFISLTTYHDTIPQTGRTHRSLAPITKLNGPDELVEWIQKWRGHPEIVDKYRNAYWRYVCAVTMDSGAYSVGAPLTQTCVSPTVDHWILSTHVDWISLRQDSPNAVQHPKKYVQYKATISAIYSTLYRYMDRCSISIRKYLRHMVKRLLTHELNR